MNTCHHLNMEELLPRIAAGDTEAFKALYDEYRHRLYGFLYQLTKSHFVSEDLLQDTFMRIWEDRERLTEIRDLKAYIFTMVKHRALNSLKRISKEELLIRQIAYKSEIEDWGTESNVRYNELKRNIDRVVRQLPPQQRTVYQMSREEGLRQEEISDRLNVTVATVKKHLTLSLRYIRKNLYVVLSILLAGRL
ncbi:MAG TPA: RNA polymerase sigma-70 factor [Puia sp.]|nr:RNA polymerase sigma-70 factor [Puia sp.]